MSPFKHRCTLLWLLLVLLTGHARARPEQQQQQHAVANEPLVDKREDGHSLTAPRPDDDELATVAPTTTPVPAVAIAQGAATGAATEATHTQAVATAVPATSSTSTSTTVPVPLLPAAPEQPEYLKHCFYAEEHLCMFGHDGHGNEAPDALGHVSTTPESDSQGFGAQINVSQGHGQSLERNANSCQCHEHPVKANSWYCCNISQMSMISSCSNISKWSNLHVRNLTVPIMDLSNPIFRSLQSLAVTDGNITKLTNAFPRHSTLKCLNISNNNISEIPLRMFKDVPHLEFFGMSRNNLSLVPHHNQNKNITVDISGNMRMLCNPLNEIINNDSFNFVNPKHSYCLYNATHEWFQSTDLVSVEQLESTKRCMTKCPVIPDYGNCKCRFESIMIIQDDQSKPKCHVDCSNLGLVELPPTLPDNTFVLNITNNKITSLGDHFQTNPTYHNINRLVADNNQIASIYEFEGTKFIENFQRIYMRNNSLSKIPEYFLNNALMDTGRRIYLAGNKLQCDCNSAKTLQNWLKERSTDIPDYMEIRCRNIPQSVIELQEAKLCQSPPDWTDYIYYLIAAEVILLLALITKVSYDYWVFKTSGYLPWPASKMPKLPCDWLCES
ncbi:protein halfway [Drosophila subobscura]|uniref:protein halfway n=1 Tax=Drosophila subobscura TaxID=7241 RepID=UPI00155B0102|nr:protein halfway [Drosophila subobscura]